MAQPAQIHNKLLDERIASEYRKAFEDWCGNYLSIKIAAGKCHVTFAYAESVALRLKLETYT